MFACNGMESAGLIHCTAPYVMGWKLAVILKNYKLLI